MKILVAVKRVIDPYVKVRVKADNSGVETQNIKMSMNPFDEIAVEEALRLREKNQASEVIVVTIGSDSSQETIRHALALGADRGILIKQEGILESLNIAKILQKIAIEEQPALILMGKQAIDGDNNQTPQMLAALLDWPQATYASKIELHNEFLRVTREIDGGLETLQVMMPAVVSTDLRLNEPRYASLPNIMKAKRKELTIRDLESLGLNLKKHVEILKVSAPVTRSAGSKVQSVDELLEKLKHEAKVL
ncbi:MAG: electron transfer flavoprotein subunit beta [Legionella sp. 40-6]|nr:electron transfer flavoprotein subunit beta/FixA family protein [Legionella sp.]OJY31307.1 MAG: electron transfer flavoprotein subunit beta [Legionella sp. 40-6]